ncbi:LAMI_0G01684g1_1 [Lachancea mirantina]|uniref:intramembrane prenyl-peptidase Rce1 n=1 Tax=Lachancea mirantina TaxID=1230905 RepID=A0A1G4K7J6_9SACH|nr:LAMI_0G01684g1_1 [Lachancea mirantina]
MISVGHLLSLYVSFSYVAALHLSFRGLNKLKKRRDDVRVIKSRIRRITIISLINLAIIPWVHSLISKGEVSFLDSLINLGVVPGLYVNGHCCRFDLSTFFRDLAHGIQIICTLYCGPLLDNLLCYVLTPGESLSEMFSTVYNEVTNIWGFRNYVFAPVTEELFYTSMVLNNYLTTQVSDSEHRSAIWITPFFFGLAHIHHAFELISTGLYSWTQVLTSAVFQVSYTVIFGIFTNIVFMATGKNLWCCIVLHSFANYMGFPRGSGLEEHILLARKRPNALVMVTSRVWKWCYLALLLVGFMSCFDQTKALLQQTLNTI